MCRTEQMVYVLSASARQIKLKINPFFSLIKYKGKQDVPVNILIHPALIYLISKDIELTCRQSVISSEQVLVRLI